MALPAATALRVRDDVFLLQGALGNLMQNAIDFAPAGSRRASELGLIGLVVIDQGPGLPDYAAVRAFERFFSLSRPYGSEQGTGIGLAFVREVAVMHGGEVRLEQEDAGTVAGLWLPQIPAS